jgi:hypothetical protein
MNVSQAMKIAKEWVEENANPIPGFYGAFFYGSVANMPKDATYYTNKDVDIYIVMEDKKQVPFIQDKIIYKNVLLECVFHNAEELSSVNAVLSDPENAHNLFMGNIILDPKGLLRNLNQSILKEYNHKKWVKARCEREKEWVLNNIQEMSEERSSYGTFIKLWFSILYLAGLITVAHLRSPTVRRCLVLVKELLNSHEKPELHEDILKVFGSSLMSKNQVDLYLQICMQVYDRATEIRRTPFYGDFNIHSYLHPYVFDGAKEMIDEGNHREAVFWIAISHLLAYTAIINDGTEEEKQKYWSGLDDLLNGLGIGTPDDWQTRLQLAKNIVDKVFQFADEVLENNPNIKS